MASFNSLHIAEPLSADNRITIKKGFLGFGSKVVYNPTSSKIQSYIKEYSPADGERITKILTRPVSEIDTAKTERFTESAIGQYMLEMCLSEDRKFVALQLQRFSDFSFKPVSELKVYEGDNAAAIAALF